MGNYTRDQVTEIVENIFNFGWRFKSYSYVPQCKGWWVLPGSDDPVKAMRRGDPRLFHQGAVNVAELYQTDALPQ
jgi:hypothetical protein